MNIKKTSKILIPLALILSLTSCSTSTKNSNNINKKDSIKTNISISKNNNKEIQNDSDENKKNIESNNLLEESLNYLTSDECDGRRYNTEGNKKTQDFIVNKFEELGLEKYRNSYLDSYNHPVVDFSKHDVILNDKHSFQLNNDFEVISCNNKLISLPISFNSDDTKECIYVSNNIKDLSSLSNKKNIKAILYTDITNFRGLGKPNTNSDQIILKISENMFESLQNTPDGNLKLKFEYSNSDIKDNNIIGKIRGTNNHNALILSAHFDHVGSIQDKIWAGALDNASGTAVLLDVASRLQKIYSSKKPNCDIIFCALNSEDAGLYGSSSFASNLGEEYPNTININLDSLGQKNSETLYIDDDNLNVNSQMSNFLVNFFKEKNYKVSLRKGEYASDHLSFIGNNVLSYNLTTLVPGENYEYLHTPEDTIDKLDIDYLNDISINLQELLQKLISTSTLLNKPKSDSIDILEEELNIINNEIINLNFGEYKFVQYKSEETRKEALKHYNKDFVTVLNGSTFDSNLKDISTQFNKTLDIPNKISNFKISSVSFSLHHYIADIIEENHKEPIIFDKVYKYNDYSTDQIAYLYLKFKSPDNQTFEYHIRSNIKEKDDCSYDINNICKKSFSDQKVIKTNKDYYLLNKNDKTTGILLLRENDISEYYITIKLNNTDKNSQDYDELFSKIIDSNLIDISLEWLNN